MVAGMHDACKLILMLFIGCNGKYNSSVKKKKKKTLSWTSETQHLYTPVQKMVFDSVINTEYFFNSYYSSVFSYQSM